MYVLFNFISDYIQKNRYQIVFYTSCFIFLIAAIKNIGYFHPDEHYQIIEFAGYKLGWSNSEELAWEFNSMLRPTLQVWLCLGVFKIFNILGVTDPYFLSFFLRLLTAIYALAAIHIFYHQVKKFLHTNLYFIFYIFCFFIWFIPFISIRFSSETWSGLSFLIGISFLLKSNRDRRDNIITGVMLALSFLFRYQAGIMIFGVILWTVIVRREKWINLLEIFIAFIIIIQCGVALDAAFYGKYVYTLWNYFNVNILDNVSATFGTSPWTDILLYMSVYTLIPIGLLISLSVLIVLVRNPLNPFLWCVIPFIIIHAIIPHKEVRFLFPIVWFAPIFILLAYEEILKYFKINTISLQTKRLIGILGIPIVFLNMYALWISVTIPSGLGQKYITQAIYLDYHGKPIRIFHTPYGNPYQPWPGLIEKFYKTSNIFFTEINRPNQIRQSELIRSDTTYMLAIRDYENIGRLLDYKIMQSGWFLNSKYNTVWSKDWSDYFKGTAEASTFQLFIIKNKYDE